MIYDGRFKEVLEQTLQQIVAEKDEEVIERLNWFYKRIYQLWWIYQSQIGLYKN